MELTSPQGQTRRLLRNIPWALILLVAVLAGIAVWNLMSASRTAHAPVWKAQAWWLAIGFGVMAVMASFDYRHLLRLAYPIYGVLTVLLIAVFARGKSAMGAQRWLDLGPAHLQPSELMKIGTILVVARFFQETELKKEGFSLPELWLPALLVAVPVGLVMKQPDLGTALMIAAGAGSMVLFAKVRWRSLLLLAAGGVVSAVVAWVYLLKPYQKRRVLTFLNPEGDILGAGYHASQSLIAVGSGQATGKGWGEGTQTQLSFLPEQHTDFIFSVWGEEQGFVGALVLVGIYLLFVMICLGVAANARDKFGAFLVVGLTAMFFWHVVVNIGMVTGMLPVVGVTLPIMSYGGSSVLTNMIAVGLIVNVAMRRGGGW